MLPERTARPIRARSDTNSGNPRVVIWSRSRGSSTGRSKAMFEPGPGDARDHVDLAVDQGGQRLGALLDGLGAHVQPLLLVPN
ncbi:hypothetical protein ABT009_37655 [Streptomyces sp. NPDC002896]|uniref:hypothetical protein n=1 Tax=Streptomyces sp. NPDC002896 TaxID=3154438 RepID=UPI003319ADCE